jgi:hypothetical protein
MDKEAVGTVVKAGLRSIAASFPAFASVAQAWNEAETVWRNKRIDKLFAYMAQDLLQIKKRIIEIQCDLTPRADLPALLERTVEKVRREASDSKIELYSMLLTNTIAAEASLTHADAVNFIETLDTLTDQDIEVLACFTRRKNIRVDSLLRDGHFMCAPIGQTQPGGANLAKMSQMIVSLSKLAGRGLIAESVEAGGAFATSGDRQHWYNQWKLKSFELLPFGVRFVAMIKGPSHTTSGSTLHATARP